MQILLADAKIMFDRASREPLTVPHFADVASLLAEEMVRLSVAELQAMLGCSRAVAEECRRRYVNYPLAQLMPAIMAYNGQAYKHLKAQSLDGAALDYGQKHLWITSFLYGLLRPMDGVAPYRMEQGVTLEASQDLPMSRFWRDRLTDVLLASVKADDGILLHLSTAEYEQLFHWAEVQRNVRVVHPHFYVRSGTGLKVQAVWAKACRGAMTRYVLQNGVTNPEDIVHFEYEGFAFDGHYGDENNLYFIRE